MWIEGFDSHPTIFEVYSMKTLFLELVTFKRIVRCNALILFYHHRTRSIALHSIIAKKRIVISKFFIFNLVLASVSHVVYIILAQITHVHVILRMS